MAAAIQSPAPRVAARKLLWAGPLAGALAALANLVVLFAGQALVGQIRLPLPPATEPQALPWVAVAAASFIPALAAAALLAGLGRFAPRPVFVFQVIAALFLLLSLAGPATLPISFAFQAVLTLMHVVAGAVTVGVLTTFAVKP